MKVIGWIDEEEESGKKVSIGTLGGWFVPGHRWADYVENLVEEAKPYAEAIRAKVIEEELRVGGDDHQSHYVPLFEDGTVGSFSYRAWGDLMAAIWSEHDQGDYHYMDFYMSPCADAPRSK